MSNRMVASVVMAAMISIATGSAQAGLDEGGGTCMGVWMVTPERNS